MTQSLKHLYFARLREFYRQPARVFWVYGFPIILALVLGLAFKNKPPEKVLVTIADGPGSTALATTLQSEDAQKGRPGRPPVEIETKPLTEALKRLRTGKATLVIEPLTSGGVSYHYDPTRPEAGIARAAADDILQRAAGRTDSLRSTEVEVTEPGSRYIDFLIPGLIGLNIMGGGLWGIGFFLVNMRIGKLLKRFAATPMPRHNYLLALVGSRLTFLVPDVAVLLLLGVLAFKMPISGNPFLIALVVLVGALAFVGIGMLVASRAQSTETVSGLMNLVMMPMWLLSGVFFSTDRYPKEMQPLIQALPLTQLTSALRAVIIEGAGIATVWPSILILAAWALVTFFLALRFFRWT